MSNKLALKGGSPVRTQPFPGWPVAGETEKRLLLEVLESGVWGYHGPKEEAFSRKFADWCGAREGFCVANGTVSLEIALRALKVSPGDEVIVPALTWLATAWAAVQVGATPVFVDVNPDTWCLDPEAFRSSITRKTRAVIPVHLYHQMADMDAILDIARSHELSVIEDCAHAHGSQWNGRGAGSLGDIGSYSFQLSKGMTAGEGGILLTNDEALAGRIFSLKNCGRKWKSERPFGFGGNYRITEFQAAMLLAQMQSIESQLARKKANRDRLCEHLGQIKGVTVAPPHAQVTRQGMYGLALRFDPGAFGGLPQDILVAALQAEGIPVQRPYDVVFRSPLWTSGRDFVHYESKGTSKKRLGLKSKCPVAQRIAETEGIVLLHHLLLGSEEDMADIATALAKVQKLAGSLRLEAWQKKMRSTARSILAPFRGSS